MSNKNKNELLNGLKNEVAAELHINLKDGDNGHLTSREAGYIGGGMVKRLVEKAKRDICDGLENDC
jgi:hypothetical protein